MTPIAQLDELLSETTEQAAARVSTVSSEVDSSNLVLYGAGTLGMTVLERLRSVGVEPVGFADDTKEKQGQKLAGSSILAPPEAAARWTKSVFVVTILNPKLSYLAARQRLQQITSAPIISFLHLAWKFPDAFLPYYQFELPQQVLSKRAAIQAGFRLFCDEESQRQFVGHLKFRLRLDYTALPPRATDAYFPRDVITGLPDDVIYVDCGAFDGDTLRGFLQNQGDDFKRIYAFEPDATNFSRLREFTNGLTSDVAGKISLYQAGVGAAKERMAFSAAGNMAASFSSSGDTEVDVLPLDETVVANGSQVFLKFDVEGAEWDALRGAEKLITETHPLLAISVYHRPDDLWEIPRYVASLVPGYRFFLRTHGKDGMDAICYAVPPQHS